MNFFQKRQKFANQIRQKQRQQIFKKNRITLIKEQKSKQNKYGTMRKENEHQLENYYQKYMKELLRIQLNQDSIDDLIKKYQLQAIFEFLPRWVSLQSLNQDKNTFKKKSQEELTELQKTYNKIIGLSLICLQSYRLLVPVTNSLIQVTSLSQSHLIRMKIPQQYLIDCFFTKCYEIFSQTTDMRVLFNCVYICGNLHKKFVCMNVKPSKNMLETNLQHFSKIQQIEDGTFLKLQQICRNYPCYENSLQIMLWFLKNCLLVYTKPSQNSNHFFVQNRKSKIQLKCIYITQRMVISICGRFDENTSIQNFTYFCQIIKQSFSLLSFTMSDSTIYHQNNGFSENNPMSQYLLNIFKTIDQSFQTFLSVFLKYIGQNKKMMLLTKSVQQMSQTMTQILINIKKIKNYEQNIPVSIPRFCTMVAKSMLKCAAPVKTQNTEISTKFLTKHILLRCKDHYDDAKIYTDKEYRKSMLKLFEQIQDQLSARQAKSIVVNYCEQNSSACEDNTWNEMIEQVKFRKYNDPQNLYLSFMTEVVVPYVLKAIDSLFREQKDAQDLERGLKIILKFTRNWQVQEQTFKNQLVKMNLHLKIIQLQEEANQLVYNAALDLIEEHHLDLMEQY